MHNLRITDRLLQNRSVKNFFLEKKQQAWFPFDIYLYIAYINYNADIFKITNLEMFNK